jgi:hypothetical protein
MEDIIVVIKYCITYYKDFMWKVLDVYKGKNILV